MTTYTRFVQEVLQRSAPQGTQHGRWPMVLLLVFVMAGCPKEAPAPAPTAMELVNITLQMQGGAAVVKKASVHSANFVATYLGTRLKATLQYRTGDMRLTYFNPQGDYQVTQVWANGHCWQRMDKVVIPCLGPMARQVSALARMRAAAWLWPLKEEAGIKLKTSKVKQATGVLDAITITGADGVVLGTLLLDTGDSLVVGFKMSATIGGKKGELVATFSNFTKECNGVKIPNRRVYTFDGEPYLDAKVSGFVCESMDAKLFARPKQVAHLTVDLKHTANYNLACTRLKGPLSGLSAALSKVAAYLIKQHLPPVGPAQLVHRKGPPQVKKSKRWVTDVCLPVSNKAWVKPKGTFVQGAKKGGEFFLFERVGDEFLRVFGVGDYQKTLPELAHKLMAEAKGMKRKQQGPLVQVIYEPPGLYPVAQQVSEVQMPIYE